MGVSLRAVTIDFDHEDTCFHFGDVAPVVISAGGGDAMWVFDTNSRLFAAGDIITGSAGGRFVQDCSDGTTSMRWVNADGVDQDIEIVRVYADGGVPYNDPGSEANERVQLGYREIDQGVSSFYIKTTADPLGVWDGSATQRWEFQGTGGLQFPDGTTQVTAWKGATASDTAPQDGYLWYNTVDGRTYIKYNNQWVDANPTILPPPDINPTLESVTFNDNTVQTTAWTGTYSYNDLTDKPETPTFVGGGDASTWLGPN